MTSEGGGGEISLAFQDKTAGFPEFVLRSRKKVFTTNLQRYYQQWAIGTSALLLPSISLSTMEGTRVS